MSLAARERAKWRCQHPGCTATQYSVGRWICFAGGTHEWRPVEPEDCRPENLAAMCQRHHLAYDAQHHKQTAYTTRKRAAATADLFDAA